MKAPCDFSRFTIDLHKGEYSTCQLLPSTLTFSGWLLHGSFLGGSANAAASLAAVTSKVRMSQYLSTGKSSEFFFPPGQTSPATSALAVNPRQQLRRSRSTFASNFDTPGQPRQQLRRSRSTSPATSALPVNLRQQPLQTSNLGAPGQPSPATSALPVNLRQQLRRSQSTLAGNSGTPGEPLASSSPRSGLDLARCRFPCGPSTSSWLARTIINISYCSK